MFDRPISSIRLFGRLKASCFARVAGQVGVVAFSGKFEFRADAERRSLCVPKTLSELMT
jgi:hypothetical protein